METGEEQAAERYADYRFFRGITRWGSRLTVAGVIFTAWYLVWNLGDVRAGYVETLVFLLSTTALALTFSLLGALVAYYLFKRRGGEVEKTGKPEGV